MNENVVVKRLQFLGVLLREADVLRQAVQLLHDQAPFDAPLDRRRLVMRKIDARGPAEHAKELLEIVPVLGRCLLNLGVPAVQELSNAHQLAGNFLGRQHEIDAVAGDGAARHAQVPGRFVLGEGDAVLFLDGSQAQGAVGSGS